MPTDFFIRELHAMPDLLALVALQKAVWGMEDHECASPHTMKAATVAGGSVLGAQADGQLIGFCFGMAAKRGDAVWLWSHMTAVHPDYQGQGIGCLLKQAQREWALANGYRVVAWTFDPMQSGNANFNFNRLGATARRYYVNHYGAMQDGINAGLASDRLEAQWRLDDSRVVELAEGEASPARPSLEEAVKLVYVDEDGALRRLCPAVFDAARYAIEIPASVAALKCQDIRRAQSWQLHLREAITALMEVGYEVGEFVRAGGAHWYVMRRMGP